MTSEKVERYCLMSRRLLSLTERKEITTLMDEMDEVWYSMSKEEVAECDRRLSQEGKKA